MPIVSCPRFRCATCQDWGTVVPRDGGQPIPCPEPDCPIRKENQR